MHWTKEAGREENVAIIDKEHDVMINPWEHSTSGPSSQKPKAPPKYGEKNIRQTETQTDFLQNARPALLQRVKIIKQNKKKTERSRNCHTSGGLKRNDS